MIEVRPRRAGTVEVTFVVPTNGLREPISVVGDFNAYRYLSAGEQWFNDEAADDYQANAFGGTDSVVDLTLADSAVPR